MKTGSATSYFLLAVAARASSSRACSGRGALRASRLGAAAAHHAGGQQVELGQRAARREPRGLAFVRGLQRVADGAGTARRLEQAFGHDLDAQHHAQGVLAGRGLGLLLDAGLGALDGGLARRCVVACQGRQCHTEHGLRVVGRRGHARGGHALQFIVAVGLVQHLQRRVFQHLGLCQQRQRREGEGHEGAEQHGTAGHRTGPVEDRPG
jgi:hypothetical protein